MTVSLKVAAELGDEAWATSIRSRGTTSPFLHHVYDGIYWAATGNGFTAN